MSASGLPFVPVLAVIFFKENMEGIKVIATVLALWGFASYLYQHYLDDLESKAMPGAELNQLHEATDIVSSRILPL